jgi:ubiquinone/menaquinone biosynthesis C-methylase UbiE
MAGVEVKWDDMHKLVRFRPQYPSEVVVKFLFTNFPADREMRKNLKILDIGFGGGRHVKLFAEQGFDVSGVDFSEEAVIQARKMLKGFNLTAELQQGDMTNLPYEDSLFDGIVSFGVFYYTDSAGMKKAISELYRVLKKNGRALVQTRTTDDYRFGKGRETGRNTFVLDTDETNEGGMTIHFLTREDVYDYYSKFSKLNLEKNEVNFHNLSMLNSNWDITVEK